MLKYLSMYENFIWSFTPSYYDNFLFVKVIIGLFTLFGIILAIIAGYKNDISDITDEETWLVFLLVSVLIGGIGIPVILPIILSISPLLFIYIPVFFFYHLGRVLRKLNSKEIQRKQRIKDIERHRADMIAEYNRRQNNFSEEEMNVVNDFKGE